MAADQSEVFAFLARPEAYDGTPAAVERIDTHAAVVFLAGDRAYKVKRAVRYDYLDFSTLERRKAACEAELAINRRTAPNLYLSVESIARAPDGGLKWGAAGEIVEWVLVMRRFPQEALFDRLAADGALDLRLMSGLAEAVARLHQAAERIHDHGGRAGMAWVIDGNAAAFAEYHAAFDAESAARVTALCRSLLDRHGNLLDARRDAGSVRRCHGDLHLRNIVLLDGSPTLFDAVEFNDEISCVDVLYDLAFLLMDLLRRGLPAHANLVFNRYLSTTGDLDGLPLLPLFLGCRAAIRAKTSAAAASLEPRAERAERLRATARDYLTMAVRLLAPVPAGLVAIGGLSGTGKSTLAFDLAPDIGPAPGALVLRTDAIRKALLGVSEHERLGPEGYTADVSRRVYATLVDRASRALAAGQAVIADAVFTDPDARLMIEAAAQRADAPFLGIWLDADRRTLEQRLDARVGDVSDATSAVLREQITRATGEIRWMKVDAGGSRDDTRERARRALSGMSFTSR